MIQIFRSANPLNALALLIYFLALKIFFILVPSPPLRQATDGLLFGMLFRFLSGLFGKSPLDFTMLALVLLFIQSLLINRMANRFRLIPKVNYLTAMSYIMLTSFFREWNSFSAALIAVTLLLFAVEKLVGLYHVQQARGLIFNAGLLIGLAGLFYLPSILFLIFLSLSLIINRPFRLSEWIIGLFGILSPFYFIGIYQFLTGHLQPLQPVSLLGWALPRFQDGYWVVVSIFLILAFFLSGTLSLLPNYFKILIQVRKVWVMLLAFAATAILAGFMNQTFALNAWILALLPISVFMANSWWSIRKIWVAELLHLGLVGFLLVSSFYR